MENLATRLPNRKKISVLGAATMLLIGCDFDLEKARHEMAYKARDSVTILEVDDTTAQTSENTQVNMERDTFYESLATDLRRIEDFSYSNFQNLDVKSYENNEQFKTYSMLIEYAKKNPNIILKSFAVLKRSAKDFKLSTSWSEILLTAIENIVNSNEELSEDLLNDFINSMPIWINTKWGIGKAIQFFAYHGHLTIAEQKLSTEVFEKIKIGVLNYWKSR